MARKRKAVKQKEMDPVTQEIYDLLHDNNNNIAVEVVTAEYEIPTPYIDVTKLPPVLDTSKLPSLEEVEVVEVEPDFLVQYIKSMKRRIRSF